MAKQTISIGGVWVRNNDEGQVEVLLEVEGVWRKVYVESWQVLDPEENLVSHIVEPAGILRAPEDDL